MGSQIFKRGEISLIKILKKIPENGEILSQMEIRNKIKKYEKEKS